MSEIQDAKTERMRQVHERNKSLKDSADVVVRHGEPRPTAAGKKVYVESLTAAALERVFEHGEEPWW